MSIETAIHVACRNKEENSQLILELLLKYGGNINIKYQWSHSNNNLTMEQTHCLMIAIRNNHDLINVIFQNNIDL